MTQPAARPRLIDATLLRRVFGVLGPAEALASMAAFLITLTAGSWSWGQIPSPTLLTMASGTAFAAIVLGQLANAYACRSQTQPIWRTFTRPNRLLVISIAAEAILLLLMLVVPPIARALGGAFPSALGWACALCAIPTVWLADSTHKAFRRKRRR